MNSSRSSVTATNEQRDLESNEKVQEKRLSNNDLDMQQTISAGEAKFQRL
jgi:hypothetical protein